MSSSLSGILSVARTALQSHQLALQVAGHNLSNANTDGFSRQRPDLVAGTPLMTRDGLLGTGVRVADVNRARDIVLEPAVRREISAFAAAGLEREVLEQLEDVAGALDGQGLSGALDTFWSAWSDLANDPLSRTARIVVRDVGERVVEGFHGFSRGVDGAEAEVRDRLSLAVRQVNEILGEIADLNARVASARAASGSAPDLEDRRDLLLDRLAAFVPIQVTRREGGMIGVSVDGIGIVEGTVANTLTVAGAGDAWRLVTSSGMSWVPTSGSMGASLSLLNHRFGALRTQLDEIARALVVGVNSAHEAGVGAAGGPGVRFFDDLGDPSTVTARTLRLGMEVRGDVDAIVAGRPDAGGGFLPGANDVALELAALRSTAVPGPLGGRSIGAAHRDMLGELGATVAERRGAEERHDLLLTAARERREAVSGVVTDEELIRVIQIQAAYTAAARLVTVVDEMYQTLLGV